MCDGPLGVLGDEGFRIRCERAESGQIVAGARVSKRHADVAEKTPAFDAFDGAVFEGASEGCFIERKVIAEERRLEGVASGEGGFGACGGEPVPRADGGAVVAAVDTIID